MCSYFMLLKEISRERVLQLIRHFFEVKLVAVITLKKPFVKVAKGNRSSDRNHNRFVEKRSSLGLEGSSSYALQEHV